MPSRVDGYIVLTLKVHEEDGQYVSECVELGVASCGETIDEAFDAIKDATAVYLTTLEDEGELEGVLAERGVRVVPGEPPEDGREVQVTARLREYVSLQTVPLPVPA
jgi:predicted RNase H-like HicB family nuclease